MKLAWVYSKGRPENWVTRAFEGQALGGSEGSMLHYAREFVRLGHEVTIFTPGATACELDGVQWKDTNDGMCQQRFDVAIALRFPEELPGMLAPLKVLYCCDPEIVELPEFVENGFVNVVITISNYQTELFQSQHPIPRDLYLVSNAGIVYSDYINKGVKKVKGRCIYCSVPARGLDALVQAWPLIREKVPYATLHVTGGFELWGMNIPIERQAALQTLMTLEGATYLGVIPREDLVREQLEAEVMLLPGRTDSPEMCCISAMECSAAGAMLVVGKIGALPERAYGKGVGYACGIEGLSVHQPTFVHYAEEALQVAHRALHYAVPKMAKYDYSVLAPQWIERFEKELRA